MNALICLNSIKRVIIRVKLWTFSQSGLLCTENASTNTQKLYGSCRTTCVNKPML
nr:MAG TPA: hypothetical protein [Caudoviricetes sp.]